MKEINMSIMMNVFGVGDLLSLATDILERYTCEEDGDEIDRLYQAIDDGLIYTRDEWTVIESYCTPLDADYGVALEHFENDLMDAINRGAICE